MEEILIGTTDRSILVFIPDGASTDGSGKTGLAHTAITVSYTRVETDNDVVLTDATSSLNALTNLTDAHNDWGWKEVSSTLAPGLYRLDLADAVFATGAWYAVVYIMVTTGEASATPKAFKLVDFDMFGQSAADLKDFADAGYDPATNKVQGVVLVDTVTTYTGNTPQTGDAFARLGAPAGASVSADIAAIEAQTDDIGVAGAGLTAVPWNAAWDAEVESECNDALIAQNLDHLVKSAVDTDFATTVHLNSVVGHLADAGGTATFDRTSDALEILGAATAPSAASIADAVWDEAIAGHLSAGSTGEALNAAGAAGDPWVTALPGAYGAGSAGFILGTNLNTTVSSRASQTSVDTIDDFLDTEVAAILADTNELQTDWANGGRLDLILDARASQTTVDAIETDTQDIQTKIGTPAGVSVSADIAAVKAETATIVADTNELQVDWANGGRLDLIVDAILADTVVIGTPAGASLSIDVAAVKTDTAAVLVDTTQIKADLPSRPTKNTQLANFPFVMVDETDGYTAETGLTVTATRSLDGAAFAACANAVSEVGNGVYKITLASTDLNADTVVLKFTATGARTRLINIVTQP